MVTTMSDFLFLTVKQFSTKHPAFPVGGLRHRIFHEQQNGLAASGTIVRNGRRVLIHEQRFFAWLENQNRSGRAA